MRYWEVMIGKWHKPWNRELESELTRKEKRAIKGLAWAEQPQTINEVGSTFTIQGFDLNYAGVILGPSVKYRNGKVIFDPSESCNEKAIRNRYLRRITGAGCMLTSLTGVYCGANPDILLEAAVTASEVMKHCGETAEARVRKEMEGTASFRTRLIDAVSLLNADELTPNLCLQIL